MGKFYRGLRDKQWDECHECPALCHPNQSYYQHRKRRWRHNSGYFHANRHHNHHYNNHDHYGPNRIDFICPFDRDCFSRHTRHG